HSPATGGGQHAAGHREGGGNGAGSCVGVAETDAGEDAGLVFGHAQGGRCSDLRCVVHGSDVEHFGREVAVGSAIVDAETDGARGCAGGVRAIAVGDAAQRGLPLRQRSAGTRGGEREDTGAGVVAGADVAHAAAVVDEGEYILATGVVAGDGYAGAGQGGVVDVAQRQAGVDHAAAGVLDEAAAAAGGADHGRIVHCGDGDTDAAIG